MLELPATFWDVMHDLADIVIGVGSVVVTISLYVYRKIRKREIMRIEQIAKLEAKRMEEIAEKKATAIKEALESALDAHEVKDHGRELKTDEQFKRQAREAELFMGKLDQMELKRRHDHEENRSRLERIDVENRERMLKLEKVDSNVDTLMEWFKEWRETMFKK